MDLEIIEVVVSHLGSDAPIRVDLRLAIGALAGLGAVLVLSPLMLISTVLRSAVEITIEDILSENQSDISVSTQAAVLLLTGLALGALFEFIVLLLEQVDRLSSLSEGVSRSPISLP